MFCHKSIKDADEFFFPFLTSFLCYNITKEKRLLLMYIEAKNVTCKPTISCEDYFLMVHVFIFEHIYFEIIHISAMGFQSQ